MVLLRALLSLRVCERIEHESWTHGFPVFRRHWGEQPVSAAVRMSQCAVFKALKHILTAGLGPLRCQVRYARLWGLFTFLSHRCVAHFVLSSRLTVPTRLAHSSTACCLKVLCLSPLHCQT